MSDAGCAPLRLLVLTVRYPNEVAYYSDWAEAFESYPGADVVVHDIGTAEGKRRLPALTRETDAIVALHATTADWLADLTEATPVLLDRRAPLAIFIGNEFNQPFPWLSEKIAAVKALQAEIVVSQLLDETASWLYAETGARVLSLPHALNPRRFYPGPDRAARRFDVASRSFPYPVYVGDDERNRIFAGLAELSRHSRLAIDVRLDERLPADAWADLLRDARATVSTEAGTWYLERDDRTARRVEALLRRSGRGGFSLPTPLRRAMRRLPSGMKDFLRRAGRKLPMTYAPLASPDVETAAEIAVLFAQTPKAPVYGKCVTARHFDALGTRTLQLLTPGRYNDILVAGEHYLEIAPDGSNIREMIEAAGDPAIWMRVTEAALVLGLRSTHAARIDQLISILSQISTAG